MQEPYSIYKFHVHIQLPHESSLFRVAKGSEDKQLVNGRICTRSPKTLSQTPVNKLFEKEKNTGRFKFIIQTVVSVFIKAGTTFVIKLVILIRNSPRVFNSSLISRV